MKDVEQQLRLLGRFQVECVIVGGVAATLHGASYLTHDLDVCYARTPENLKRVEQALQSVHAQLRGAPTGLPFLLDAETLRRGLNFTFDTDLGALDLFGGVAGVGDFAAAMRQAVVKELFGFRFPVLALDRLIASKRQAGRTKDLLVLPELEAILEYQQSQSKAQQDA